MSNVFAEKQRAKGLYPCPDCNGTGVEAAAFLKANDHANRTGEILPIESAFCVGCNGYGWLRRRIVRIVSPKIK